MRRIQRLCWVGGPAGVVGVLCGLMVVVPGVGAQEVSGRGLPVERHAKPLTEQERVLHALNRFTFGPRPGDVAAVESMGLQRWFEMQLHPERIDDSGFVAEMGQFPAMGLPEEELKKRFPSGQMIRQMGRRGESVPGDPVEGAIYADAEAVYREKVENKAVNGPAGVGVQGVVAGPTLAAKSGGDDGAPGGSVETHVSEARHGAPGDVVGDVGERRWRRCCGWGRRRRFGRLVAMSPETMLGFREAVKGKDRVRLVAGLTPAQREAVEAMVESPERVVATEDMQMRLMRDIDSRRQLQAVMTEFWLNHFNVYLRKNEQEPYLLPAYEQQTILPHALGKFEDLLVATAKSPAMLMYLDNWESVGPDSSYADGGRLRVVGARAGVAGPTRPQSARTDGAPAVGGGGARKTVAGPTASVGTQVSESRPGAPRMVDGMQRVVAGQQLKVRVPKGINENYGRELMELHTLGVGGGYTQQDVIEVAKCFTGWTIDRPYAGGGMRARMGAGVTPDGGTPGEFVFDPRRHEPGSKMVLGHVIAEGGMNEGLEVLHILATSPATAHFISQELAVRFVSDNPPAVLVNRMAATYLKSDGDISAVLTAMFRSKEFWTPGVYRAKVKTPVEFLASAVRASDATVTNALPLVQAMDRLGMPVWGMQTPNGYGWTAEDWVSSNGLLSRMNFALVLSGNRVPGVRTDWAAVLGGPAVADAATERELEGDLLGQAAFGRTRAAVMEGSANPTAQAEAAAGFVGSQAAGQGIGGGLVRTAVVRPVARSEAPLDTMAGLLLGSPEFQRR